jgi:prepilin signal peptidase PulO-like enzyme (type II secretory pathway)
MLTISIILGLIFILFSLILKEYAFIVFGVVIFILPYLLKFAESLEEAAMKKNIKVSRLTIGDWLAREVRVGKKIIKPNWEGLNEKELKIIRGSKIKRVWVKEGIPFVPVFLIAFIILVVIIKIYNG